MSLAALIVEGAILWGWIGAGVAVLFLFFGIDQVDEDAQGAYIFRPLLVPGVLLIWPLVLWRWYRLALTTENWAGRYRPRRTNHRLFAYGLAVAVVTVIIVGIMARQTWPADIAPVQLTTPEEVSE